MTLREFARMYQWSKNEKIEIVDNDRDVNGGLDIMLPCLIYGDYSLEEIEMQLIGRRKVEFFTKHNDKLIVFIKTI